MHTRGEPRTGAARGYYNANIAWHSSVKLKAVFAFRIPHQEALAERVGCSATANAPWEHNKTLHTTATR